MEKILSVPTLADILATHEAIQPYIHRTPVMTSQSLDELSGARLFFKCENFQKIGAFKMRGAMSAALRLTDAEKAGGLATHSSGNHAQAVARAAKILNVPAYIVMPDNAPEVKQTGTRAYGAEIIFCKPTLEARETTLNEVVAKTGAAFIHPFDNYDVIAGQATSARELFEEGPLFDAVIAPIGGGGLMSGTALATHFLVPEARVYGAEPKAVDDAWRSKKSGHIELNTSTDTIADGLKTNLSEKTFDIINRLVNDIFTVSEEEIVNAMRLIWERMKIVVEPSCAVPFAAILANPGPFAGKKVGIILTGGNVDMAKLPFLGN